MYEEYYYAYPDDGGLLVLLILASIVMVYGLAMIVAGPKGATFITKMLRHMLGGIFAALGRLISGEAHGKKKKKRKH